jgi:hypothetical protein
MKPFQGLFLGIDRSLFGATVPRVRVPRPWAVECNALGVKKTVYRQGRDAIRTIGTSLEQADKSLNAGDDAEDDHDD